MRRKRRSRWVIALVVTITLLALVICLDGRNNKKEKEFVVWQLTKSLDKGTRIGEEQLSNSLRVMKVPQSVVPLNAIQKKEELVNQRLRYPVGKGQILTSEHLINEEAREPEYRCPVEVSVQVEEASQAVGGTLRTGDQIDISVVREETNESQLIASRVVVTKSIHADGSLIGPEDSEKSASIVNFLIDQSEVEAFNQSLGLGKVRICRYEY